jgi:exopolysaccharide biosynthesis polyprenyl glycosylphosphotransferase
MIPRRFFWLVDAAFVIFAFCLAYALWPLFRALVLELPLLNRLPAVLRPEGGAAVLGDFRSMTWMLPLVVTVAIFTMELSGGYRPLIDQSRTRVILTSALSALMAGAVITFVLFLVRRFESSRLFLVTFIGFGSISLTAVRMSLRQYLVHRRAAGFYTKSVIVIARHDMVVKLSQYFVESVPKTDYRLFGYLEIPGDRTRDECALERIGAVSELADLLVRKPVHEVIAVQPEEACDWIAAVIEQCDSTGVVLRIVPQPLLTLRTHVLAPVAMTPFTRMPAVVLAPPHFDSDALFFKRLLDIVVSAILLAFLSPLFLLIAIAVKLTNPRANILYRWNVVGRNGARFTGYKFTTMHEDADARRNDLLDRNEMTGPVFKIKDDPRVTRFGKFLRKYSLNELPQLWSVLRGDMSLVGPRPAFPHELDGYGFWHKRKLSIRPGITCLWQVRGRNKISNFDDWVKMDLEYIDNWSLWLDFKILCWTAWAVVAGTGS